MPEYYDWNCWEIIEKHEYYWNLRFIVRVIKGEEGGREVMMHRKVRQVTHAGSKLTLYNNTSQLLFWQMSIYFCRSDSYIRMQIGHELKGATYSVLQFCLYIRVYYTLCNQDTHVLGWWHRHHSCTFSGISAHALFDFQMEARCPSSPSGAHPV